LNSNPFIHSDNNEKIDQIQQNYYYGRSKDCGSQKLLSGFSGYASLSAAIHKDSITVIFPHDADIATTIPVGMATMNVTRIDMMQRMVGPGAGQVILNFRTGFL
jgi:hypothetical protein